MGLSVGCDTVHAVLVERESIRWAGKATYAGPADLADVIARLAGEGTGIARPRRVRAVLERPIVQFRTIAPAPPLRDSALQRWVALEAPRLFRKNGAPLVTAVRRLSLDSNASALWAAAVAEPLLEAILTGCAEAGLAVASIGVSSEVLPHALCGQSGTFVMPNGRAAEQLEISAHGAWRSRWQRLPAQDPPAIPWPEPLAALGQEAGHFAAAYATGTAAADPKLLLLPPRHRGELERHSRRRLVRLAALAGVVWLAAVVVYVARLSTTLHTSTRFLAAVRGPVDSALNARRELAAARLAVASVDAAESARSHQAEWLAAVAAALPNSAYLMSWQVTPERVVRLAGYAPLAPRVLAALERLTLLRDVRFEGPVTREAVPGVGERDRFAVVARLTEQP